MQFLLSPLESLSHVGVETAKKISTLTGRTVLSLLWHAPVALLERKGIKFLSEAESGKMVTISVAVRSHVPPLFAKRTPYRVQCSDGSQELELIFFHPNLTYLKRVLPIGKTCVVSGKIEWISSQWQIVHPDYIGDEKQKHLWQGIEPIYPLTYGISQRVLRKIILEALRRCPELPEWLSEVCLKEMGWPSWRQGVLQLHHPSQEEDLSPDHPVRQRLAYDELLAHQVLLQAVKQSESCRKGRSIPCNFRLRTLLLEHLPFSLTQDQFTALNEIDRDMKASTPMVRLLQGDVGSGKTIVAFLMLLNAVEAGHQAAYLAPTEILARQVGEAFRQWGEKIGIFVRILTARNSKTDRDKIQAELADGQLSILVGTHAVLEDNVLFKDLAAVVIDEQHRFGVDQRLKLAQKGEGVDLLVMTATPIPRTLMLANHGDLDCSYLRNKPLGRKAITTKVMEIEKLTSIIEAVRREIDRGGKIYWVCPLVEESKVLSLTSAEDRYQDLQHYFKEEIGLVHGRLKPAEKEKVMDQFVQGKIRILVATTVIEVGVHVEDATVMIIEHADRFGLAQLHQLRGRIGRGQQQASCLLLYQGRLSPIAHRRLGIMRETNDGFRIAEEDLRLRGGGEILGIRQSGMPEFKFVDFEVHQPLLIKAYEEAKDILQSDPDLSSARGKKIRLLLQLCGKQAATEYLKAG